MSKKDKIKRRAAEDAESSAELIQQAELAMRAELAAGRSVGSFWQTRFAEQAQTDAGKVGEVDAMQARADADAAILALDMAEYTANRAQLMRREQQRPGAQLSHPQGVGCWRPRRSGRGCLSRHRSTRLKSLAATGRWTSGSHHCRQRPWPARSLGSRWTRHRPAGSKPGRSLVCHKPGFHTARNCRTGR